MKTLINQIRECIENKLNEGYHKFIIFPFGDVGVQTKYVLNNMYGIKEILVLDNYLCKYNKEVKELAVLEQINKFGGVCLILASTNEKIFDDLKSSAKKYFNDESIAILPSMLNQKETATIESTITKIGKYSYGSLCFNHPSIEEIGAFCSFAQGCSVVRNHELHYITTHPMLYEGVCRGNEYSEYSHEPWYFDGVQPKTEKVKKFKKIKIGNDVWLGWNVIITNYANIGNGVIAGAGAVITKDVPDYAVVVGAPARIIRYRYSQEEIESLNRISWWNWTDDQIRKRYNDFYLPISEFIKKYIKKL